MLNSFTSAKHFTSNKQFFFLSGNEEPTNQTLFNDGSLIDNGSLYIWLDGDVASVYKLTEGLWVKMLDVVDLITPIPSIDNLINILVNSPTFQEALNEAGLGGIPTISLVEQYDFRLTTSQTWLSKLFQSFYNTSFSDGVSPIPYSTFLGLSNTAIESYDTPFTEVLNTPPVTLVVGMKFLVGDTPTGDFAGQAGKVANYTISGWQFVNFNRPNKVETYKDSTLAYVYKDPQIYNQFLQKSDYKLEIGTGVPIVPNSPSFANALAHPAGVSNETLLVGQNITTIPNFTWVAFRNVFDANGTFREIVSASHSITGIAATLAPLQPTASLSNGTQVISVTPNVFTKNLHLETVVYNITSTDVRNNTKSVGFTKTFVAPVFIGIATGGSNFVNGVPSISTVPSGVSEQSLVGTYGLQVTYSSVVIDFVTVLGGFGSRYILIKIPRKFDGLYANLTKIQAYDNTGTTPTDDVTQSFIRVSNETKVVNSQNIDYSVYMGKFLSSASNLSKINLQLTYSL